MSEAPTLTTKPFAVVTSVSVVVNQLFGAEVRLEAVGESNTSRPDPPNNSRSPFVQ